MTRLTNTDLLLINALGIMGGIGVGGRYVSSTGLIRFLCLKSLTHFYRTKLEALKKAGWIEEAKIGNRYHWRLSVAGQENYRARVSELIAASRLTHYKAGQLSLETMQESVTIDG